LSDIEQAIFHPRSAIAIDDAKVQQMEEQDATDYYRTLLHKYIDQYYGQGTDKLKDNVDMMTHFTLVKQINNKGHFERFTKSLGVNPHTAVAESPEKSRFAPPPRRKIRPTYSRLLKSKPGLAHPIISYTHCLLSCFP